MISKGSIIIKPKQTFSLLLFWILFSFSFSHINLKSTSILSLFLFLFGPVSGLTNGQLMSLFSNGLERLLFSRWHINPPTHAHKHIYTDLIVSLWTKTEFCSDPSLSRNKQRSDRHRELCGMRKWQRSQTEIGWMMGAWNYGELGRRWAEPLIPSYLESRAAPHWFL